MRPIRIVYRAVLTIGLVASHLPVSAAANPKAPTRATPATAVAPIATIDTAAHGKVRLSCTAPRTQGGGTLSCTVKRLSDGKTSAATVKQVKARADAAATWEVTAPWIDTIEVGARRNGMIFKGPFAAGASVRFVPLDAGSARTVRAGQRGRFSVAIRPTGPLWAEASGVYYDEAAGQLAAAPLRLDAVHGPRSTPDVTAATHLRARRVLALLQEMPFEAADRQARIELGAALGVPDGTVDDVWLGTALTTAAPTPAALQRLLDEWAADLTDGTLSPAARRRFADAVRDIDIRRAREDLRAWLTH